MEKTKLLPYVLFVLIAVSLAFFAGKHYSQTPTGAFAGEGIREEVREVPGGEVEFKEEMHGQEAEEQPIQETPAGKIIKEYAPGDVEVLRDRALELVKKSECYRQEYGLDSSEGEENYRNFYSTTKTVNLVYDFNEQFHGWIVFKLVKINRLLKTDSLKVNIDVANGEVSCEDISLDYSDGKA